MSCRHHLCLLLHTTTNNNNYNVFIAIIAVIYHRNIVLFSHNEVVLHCKLLITLHPYYSYSRNDHHHLHYSFYPDVNHWRIVQLSTVFRSLPFMDDDDDEYP
mmetsp:Transcript_29737/g.47678  ORF Transcript_29737/g.47678 Transcript_29737/m.47678 type:complete len:102 (-) Transcript_29737:102-407(-)